MIFRVDQMKGILGWRILRFNKDKGQHEQRRHEGEAKGASQFFPRIELNSNCAIFEFSREAVTKMKIRNWHDGSHSAVLF
jgi:hypothetical protein